MTGAPLLRASGVRVTYPGLTAVEVPSLALGEGEVLGVIGASAAGKTTLLKALAGLVPHEGTVELFDAADGGWRAPRAGERLPVFQNAPASLDPRLTVGESLAEAWRCAQRRGGRDRAAEDAALAQVGLDPALGARRPQQLSVGQCQRVQLARAALRAPRVLCCDEVGSALDPLAREALAGTLASFAGRGMGVVLATHDLWLAYAACDRLVVLDAGAMVEAGPAREILAAPRSAAAQALVTAVLPPDPSRARARLGRTR